MTDKHEIPDHRCGFEISSYYVYSRQWEGLNHWFEDDDVYYCRRKTWGDTNHCIWHAEVKNKPIEELKAARADGPELLAGAYLVGVVADDVFTFQKCGLGDAILSDGGFSSTQFHGATLTETRFHNTGLHEAEFNGAFAQGAEFHNAELFKADFSDAGLFAVEFCDANLFESQFFGAGLLKADCSDADIRNADFTHAILHDTLLTRSDCRGTTFINAALYETVFADTRINSLTTFYDSESGSITSRPAVTYEENPNGPTASRLAIDYDKDSPTWGNLSGDIHAFEAAEWVYRRLEKLHDENALSERAADFHISKEEVRRKYQWKSGEYARYFVSTLQWHVSGHGESIPRIFGSAACLILACGILYPFVGGFESSSTNTAYRLTEFSQIISFEGIVTLLQGIYFSVITFTTIGYGDLYPTGVGSKLLVGFESLSGAILIALFVFVLGRRVAR